MALVWLAAAAQANAPSGFGPLVSQILAFFPSLVADVVEVKEGELILSVGRKEDVRVGMEFSLFREGRELRHPKTGMVLGRVEEPLGVVTVSQVFEAYSIATVPGAGVQPGDRARISTGKVTLMVMALSSPEIKSSVMEGAVNQLWEELAASGRFQLISGDALAAYLAEEGISPETVLQGEGLAGTAGRHRVGHLLVVYFKQVQAKPFVEARLFSFLPGRETTPIVGTGLFVPSAPKPKPSSAAKERFSSNPRPQEPSRPPSRSFLTRWLLGEAQRGASPARSDALPFRELARFGFPVVAMDVAVAPPDGIPRLVITDGERILLYRIANRALEAEWSYAAGPSGRVISVQLADLDGDGVLEVVANRYHPQQNIGLSSFVLTTRGGKPAVVVQDLSQILFAVDADGEGVKKTLWLQPFTPNGFFVKGRVERGSLRNGSLVSDGPVRVPSDFRAVGATMSNIAGQGQRALVYIDDQNRLAVAVEGEERWRSASRVGGGGYAKMEVSYAIEPTPVSVDLDGDGVEEILVPQNQLQGTLGVVSRGPAGYRLQSVAIGSEGMITGLGVIQGDGAPTLIAAVVRFATVFGLSLFKTSAETQVLMTTPE